MLFHYLQSAVCCACEKRHARLWHSCVSCHASLRKKASFLSEITQWCGVTTMLHFSLRINKGVVERGNCCSHVVQSVWNGIKPLFSVHCHAPMPCYPCNPCLNSQSGSFTSMFLADYLVDVDAPMACSYLAIDVPPDLELLSCYLHEQNLFFFHSEYINNTGINEIYM